MFIPKRHFVEMDEMTVVEMGELIEMYSSAIKKMRSLGLVINEKAIERFLFFWRLRDTNFEETSQTRRLSHFHMHLTPDVEGLFDPLLTKDARDWDPTRLAGNRGQTTVSP